MSGTSKERQRVHDSESEIRTALLEPSTAWGTGKDRGWRGWRRATRVDFSKFRTRELLEYFFDLQEEVGAKQDLLEELLFLMVPLCYWNELDRRVAQISDDFMRLPLVEPGFAEIVQAAYDGHAVEFLRLPEDPLRSPRSIQAPRRPAAGGSPTLEGAELIDHLLQDLLGRSFKGDPFLAIDRFVRTETMPAGQRFEQRRIIISESLKKQRERHQKSFL